MLFNQLPYRRAPYMDHTYASATLDHWLECSVEFRRQIQGRVVRGNVQIENRIFHVLDFVNHWTKLLEQLFFRYFTRALPWSNVCPTARNHFMIIVDRDHFFLWVNDYGRLSECCINVKTVIVSRTNETFAFEPLSRSSAIPTHLLTP